MLHKTMSSPFISIRHLCINSHWWLCAALLAATQTVLASGSDLPQMCSVDTRLVPDPTTGSPTEAADCYEFGASVGELGWNWRKKMPSHVRWVMRKDASSLCGQAQTELGHKVDSPVPGGCVFLAPTACTIVTTGPISPASIGNAVRDCVP